MNKAELFKIFYETDKAEAIKFIKEAFSIETPVINVFRTPKEAFNLESEKKKDHEKYNGFIPTFLSEADAPNDFQIITTPKLKNGKVRKILIVDIRDMEEDDFTEENFTTLIDYIFSKTWRKYFELVVTLDQFAEIKDFAGYNNGLFTATEKSVVSFRVV